MRVKGHHAGTVVIIGIDHNLKSLQTTLSLKNKYVSADLQTLLNTLKLSVIALDLIDVTEVGLEDPALIKYEFFPQKAVSYLKSFTKYGGHNTSFRIPDLQVPRDASLLASHMAV